MRKLSTLLMSIASYQCYSGDHLYLSAGFALAVIATNINIPTFRKKVSPGARRFIRGH